MVCLTLSDLPSASKLRRLRSAATKKRLFESSIKDDTLVTISSQLAILTSTVDTFIGCLSFGSCYNQSFSNPDHISHTVNAAACAWSPEVVEEVQQQGEVCQLLQPVVAHVESVIASSVVEGNADRLDAEHGEWVHAEPSHHPHISCLPTIGERL